MWKYVLSVWSEMSIVRMRAWRVLCADPGVVGGRWVEMAHTAACISDLSFRNVFASVMSKVKALCAFVGYHA